MATITDSQFRKALRQSLVEVYKERVSPTSFLRSFFPSKTRLTRFISIEVQRGTEKVAYPVFRGAGDGNFNRASAATERVIEPPYYWEYIDATQMRLYDYAIGTRTRGSFTQLVDEMADEQAMVRDKIERSYELQCAQALEDGTVQLETGNIEYPRKAASLADVSSTNPWDTASNDPIPTIETGTDFLRTEGKFQGAVINMICGQEALTALMNNNVIQNRGDLRNMTLTEIGTPERRPGVGASLHGFISAGSHIVRIWSYPQYYEDAQGNMKHYIDPKKVVMIPENPTFNLSFAAVPQLINSDGSIPQQGAYITYDFVDQRKPAHEIHTKSAGVAIPTAIDQIYTVKVIP